MPSRLAVQKSLRLAIAVGALAVANCGRAQSISANRIATHQLGFSGATLSVREDYRHTKFPVAHRTLILRGPNGRATTLALSDGGPGDLSGLSLYARLDPQHDERGRAKGGDFLLIGARECVGFDPVFLIVTRCTARPPCDPKGTRPGFLYLGRFDWATGFDPPHGDFKFGWRFLPIEDGVEESFCPRAA